MANLISPGVSVTITDESMYASVGQSTIPLIIMATASNKTSPVAGAGIAPYTVPTQANNLYLATSQRDLIQNFGNPIFYSSQGTPLHGYELNEYGLWAAYSYLGVSSQCYVLRADLDLGALLPTTTAPIGSPVAGTYWFDLGNTQFGVFRSNGNASPGAAWSLVTVLVALTANVDGSNKPLNSFGSAGNVCIVPTTASNYLYENIAGTWYKIGSTEWSQQHTTVLTGTNTAPALTQNNSIVINGTTVTITQVAPTLANLVSDITSASISNITASIAVSGALVLTNTAGGNITLSNGTGTPLAALGLTASTFTGVSVTYNNSATYPSGLVPGSFWIKGNPANNGANWKVKYYNATLAAFVNLTAPFYAFVSTDLDGNVLKDAAALTALGSPSTGTVYIGYDSATGDMQIRRWSGSQWQSLVYEADFTGPQTAPPAGTYWFNNNFLVDIMYGNGSNWTGYRHMYPSTDINGPQITGSAPSTQSTGDALVQGDLWIDSSNLEQYPRISTWDIPTLSWVLVDNTDQTTPYGIVFADARQDSGPTFTGITNSAAYNYSSTAAADLALSDFVEPDAPDPRSYPAGTLLFNTRYSSNNVKAFQPTYFRAGGLSPTTDYTLTAYNVGATGFTFPPLTSGARWVTTSGNQVNGAPYMGRKAQRAMVVNALAAAVTANSEIRSEIVFFNLMSAPGYPELIPDFVSLNTDMKKIAFCVGDTPARLASDGTSIQNWANNTANAAITGEDGLTIGDDYTGLYYPWGLGTNLDGSEIMIPSSAIGLVTIAYNDQVAYPWYAPAGFTRGLVSNASSVGYLSAETNEYVPVILNQGQRDVLYTNRINPIAYIPNRGLVVYGQKTLGPTTTALNRINVARLVNYVAYNLDIILKPFLFEPNTGRVRATVVSLIQRFFNQLVTQNGLYDYAVVCDSTNNTPATIDQNELWVDCAIQPVKAVEFIYIPVRILATQAVI